MLAIIMGGVLPVCAGPGARQEFASCAIRRRCRTERAPGFFYGGSRVIFEITIALYVIQEDGRRLQFRKSGEIFLQRPDRLYAEIRSMTAASPSGWTARPSALP
jgi:hypothetical protein